MRNRKYIPVTSIIKAPKIFVSEPDKHEDASHLPIAPAAMSRCSAVGDRPPPGPLVIAPRSGSALSVAVEPRAVAAMTVVVFGVLVFCCFVGEDVGTLSAVSTPFLPSWLEEGGFVNSGTAGLDTVVGTSITD